MFIFNHKLDFHNYWRLGVNPGKRIEIILYALFSQDIYKFHNPKDDIGEGKLLKHDKYSDEFNKTFKLNDKELIHFKLILKHVTAYLLIFCKNKFTDLIEEYKENFEFLSYSDFSSFEIDDIKNRIKELFFKNSQIVYYRGDLLDVHNDKFGLYKFSSGQLRKSQELLSENYYKQLSNLSIDLNNLNQTIEKELLSGSIYKKLGFASLFHTEMIGSPNAYNPTLESTINFLFKNSLDNTLMFAIQSVNRFKESIHPQYFIPLIDWHSTMRQLCELAIQWDLIHEMEVQFKYKNHFESKLYGTTDENKEIVDKLAMTELAKKPHITRPILKNIILSKSRNSSYNPKDHKPKDKFLKPSSVDSALDKYFS